MWFPNMTSFDKLSYKWVVMWASVWMCEWTFNSLAELIWLEGVNSLFFPYVENSWPTEVPKSLLCG